MDYISCMNKATLVVFLLLFSLPLWASDLTTSIASLETAWATTYYINNESQQKQAYPQLIEQAQELANRYPNSAEPKIWQATILASSAEFQSPLQALATIKQAKTLLEQAIKLNPQAMDGAAFVTLGSLYYMVPSWPVSFGDTQKAEQLLKASLAINPNGIDANYFYADYLLQQDRLAEAEIYFNKAAQSPIRSQQPLADSQLQNEAKLALANTQQRKLNNGRNKFLSLFTTATYSGE